MSNGFGSERSKGRVRRHLENVRIDGKTVHVTGWMFATDGRGIRDLRVRSFPKVSMRVREIRRGDSPDVASRHPTVDAAKSCRFHLTLEVSSTFPVEGLLLQLRPVFDADVGGTWHVGVGLTAAPAAQVTKVGGGNDVGLEFLDYFVDYSGLSETEAVLDFGCGTGRMAVPLTRYLGPRSTYVGVDVDTTLIDWCNTNVAANDSRFRFVHSDARNAMYNPTGSDRDCDVIPVGSDAFSFAIATSVFTHLRANQVRSYLAEIARALQAGGRAVVTAFLVDPKVDVGRRDGMLRFVPLDDVSWTADPSLPEFAVGYRRETFEDWVQSAGLVSREVLPGSWSGRSDGHSFQDILLLERH